MQTLRDLRHRLTLLEQPEHLAIGAERAGRTVAFGKRIGKLARRVAETKPNDALTMLMKEHHLDAIAAKRVPLPYSTM